MTTLLIILTLWIAIPVLGVLLTGRQLTTRGWVYVIAFWWITWILWKTEELP